MAIRGCYNPKSKIATPHIDRLAREGMRFTDAHAPGPLCHPSRYGLMTGRYPFRTDITRWPKQPLIEEGQMTIASLLRDAGLSHRDGGQVASRLSRRRLRPAAARRAGGLRVRQLLRPARLHGHPAVFLHPGRPRGHAADGHIAEHHSEGWSPTQGAFWREGGIAPGLELKDVLPRLTDEACAVINAQADKKPGRAPAADALPRPHRPAHPVAALGGVRRQKRRGNVWRLRHDGGCANRPRARRVGQGGPDAGHAGDFHLRQRPDLACPPMWRGSGTMPPADCAA